jgi:hypothetical protein
VADIVVRPGPMRVFLKSFDFLGFAYINREEDYIRNSLVVVACGLSPSKELRCINKETRGVRCVDLCSLFLTRLSTLLSIINLNLPFVIIARGCQIGG